LVYSLIKTPFYINLSQAHSYHIPLFERCDKNVEKNHNKFKTVGNLSELRL
jgi:hypothetical protein